MKFFRALLSAGILASTMSVSAAALAGDGCYICGSGSSCQQCRYGDKDTQDKRKACEAKGCKVSGTTSCSTAANVKVCAAPAPKSTAPVDAWLRNILGASSDSSLQN